MTETLARPVVPAAEERARLKEGVHIERCSRRVRTYFGGKLIADSEHVLLVYETKRPPAYWFPIADVRIVLRYGFETPDCACSGGQG